MTYYEELGVSPTASRPEIRQAYKRLARLLHPDHCSDEPTRRLADLQMKRLNGILAELTDAARRAAYDCRLASGPPLQKPADPGEWWREPRWRNPAIAVAVAVLVLVVCAIWPVRTPPRLAVPGPAPSPSASPPAPNAVRRRNTRTRPKPEVDAVPETSSSDTPGRNLDAPELEHPSAATPPAAASDTPHTSAPQGIAGEWLFVPSPGLMTDGYPPEFIELRVSDDHGAIHGRYRARYRVADRAISPNVAFQFEGRASAGGGILPWKGGAGAQGEIKLRLLETGDLDVEWEADQLGEVLGLISGKARLVRKID